MLDVPAWIEADRQALACSHDACAEDHTCANHRLLARLHGYAQIAVGLWHLVEEAVWDGSGVDSAELFETVLALRLIEKHPEPYDPDRHPPIEVDPGDPWYRRTALAEALAARRLNAGAFPLTSPPPPE